MISVTEKAAARLKRMIERSGFPPETAGIRFAVKAGGCSGFLYIPLSVAQKQNPKDTVFESQGIKVFVDPRSLPIVEDTEIDLSDNMIEGYIFKNPKAKSSCGCGVSFELKK
jgi:iron-sulfur cluster assembly protein